MIIVLIISRRVPESTAKLIFLQIVNAVEYLHSLGFVHRDLKDEVRPILLNDLLQNVVIDEKYNVKLIDFGSTTRMPAADDCANYFSLFNGTLHFAAPEILQGNTYRGPEAEVWALGVLLYTLMYGENPFQTPEDIVDMKIRYPSKPERTPRRYFYNCV
jgi:serine/threonine protein kinase